MLYNACKSYLMQKLQEAGIKTNIYTSEKALERCQESHMGAVLFESERAVRNAAKKFYGDKEGERTVRKKLYDRSLTFHAIIGEYTDEAAEKIYEELIRKLGKGFYDDGNWVGIEIQGADWVDRDDSILKAKIAVQVAVVFTGGLYEDGAAAQIGDAGVTVPD